MSARMPGPSSAMTISPVVVRDADRDFGSQLVFFGAIDRIVDELFEDHARPVMDVMPGLCDEAPRGYRIRLSAAPLSVADGFSRSSRAIVWAVLPAGRIPGRAAAAIRKEKAFPCVNSSPKSKVPAVMPWRFVAVTSDRHRPHSEADAWSNTTGPDSLR